MTKCIKFLCENKLYTVLGLLSVNLEGLTHVINDKYLANNIYLQQDDFKENNDFIETRRSELSK